MTQMPYVGGLLMALTAGVVWAMGHTDKSDGLVIGGLMQWVMGMAFQVGHREGFMAGFFTREDGERESARLAEITAAQRRFARKVTGE